MGAEVTKSSGRWSPMAAIRLRCMRSRRRLYAADGGTMLRGPWMAVLVFLTGHWGACSRSGLGTMNRDAGSASWCLHCGKRRWLVLQHRVRSWCVHLWGEGRWHHLLLG